MEPVEALLLSLVAPPNHRCYLCEREWPTTEDGLCDDCRRSLKLAISPAPPAGLDGLSVGIQYCEPLGSIFYRFKTQERREYTPFLAQDLLPFAEIASVRRRGRQGQQQFLGTVHRLKAPANERTKR